MTQRYVYRQGTVDAVRVWTNALKNATDCRSVTIEEVDAVDPSRGIDKQIAYFTITMKDGSVRTCKPEQAPSWIIELI